MSSSIDPEKLYGEARAAFASGDVFNASDDKLKRYIQGLALHAIHNPLIRHQTAVMVSAITQIQTSSLIHKINRQNTWFGILVIVISLFSLASSIIQIFTALKTCH